MAVVTTTLFNGRRRLVVRRLSTDTSAGEAAQIFVDKSTFIGPNGLEPSRLVIERVQWNVSSAITVTLLFDHTADDIVDILAGEQDREYPDGLIDPASAGGTGDLLITVPAVAGVYDVTVTLRKKD